MDSSNAINARKRIVIITDKKGEEEQNIEDIKEVEEIESWPEHEPETEHDNQEDNQEENEQEND